jgi:hypothetical protein
VEVTILICMVFGDDLFCDLLEMLNFNKYRRAVANHRNSVEKYKRPDSLTVKSFGLHTEVYRFESRWRLFSIYFLARLWLAIEDLQ